LTLADKYLRALAASLGESDEPVAADETIGYAAAPEVEAVTETEVSRGDSLIDDGEGVPLTSEIDGVSDEQWTEFVRGMMAARLSAVSESNNLGMFEMTPRRLADFKYVERLTRSRYDRPDGKKHTIWVAKFIAPMTTSKFLRSPRAQYHVFCQSMRDYVARIDAGEVDACDDLSLSGTLAVLHRGGPGGARTWARGDRFESTVALVERVDGVF
jgi:hypothetical protein